MSENRRDLGLVRVVGTWGLAASIFNIVVGAGIFAVPGTLAAAMGPFAPFAFLIAGVATGSVAICFAESGSRVPTSGGAYGCIEAAFGPLAGYVAGTLFWFSAALACGGVLSALAEVAEGFLAPQWAKLARTLVIVGVSSGFALVNASGVSRGTRLVGLMTAIKMVPLAIFVLVGAGAVHRVNFAGTTQASSTSIGHALILAMFLVGGMEVPLAASGEVIEPGRTIPRALALALASVTALYIAIQLVAQGTLGSAITVSRVPLADAMTRVNPALRPLMLLGAAVSMTGWVSSDLLGSPRVLFAFGRDGLLPRFFGHVHPGTHAPYVSICFYAALAVGFALTGTFGGLAVLATLASSVLYIGTCAATWQLARHGIAQAGPPLNYRWLGAAVAIGIGSMFAMIAMASRAEIIDLVALVGASALLYQFQTAWIPHLQRSATTWDRANN